MASIEKRTRQGQLRYYVRYRDLGGRQVVKVFDRKVDAEKHLISVESSKLAGTFIDSRRAALTLGEWSVQWLAAQNHLGSPRRGRATRGSSPSRSCRVGVP